MYKSKKKPKKESLALKFIRERREAEWEQIQGNEKKGNKSPLIVVKNTTKNRDGG